MSSEPVIPHSGRCVNIPCSPFMFVVLLQVFVVVVVVAQILADARSCLYSVSSEAVTLVGPILLYQDTGQGFRVTSSRFWLLAQRSRAQKFHCQQMTSRDLEVGICGSEYTILQLLFKISHVLCFHIPFQFVLQQLGVLISIVKQHIRNYLDEIFGLIKVRLCTLLSSTLKHPYCLVNSTQRTAIGLKGLIIMPLDETSIKTFTAKCGQRQISFSKILTNKQRHVKVQAESFHLNGHIRGFGPQTQKLESPYKTPSSTLAVKGLMLFTLVVFSGLLDSKQPNADNDNFVGGANRDCTRWRI